MGERTANPLSVTETCHPSHLASWFSVITALSQPCHHKHRSPDWAVADGGRDRARATMLGCQDPQLMQCLFLPLGRTQNSLFPRSQALELKWHLCPGGERAENWYAVIFFFLMAWMVKLLLGFHSLFSLFTLGTVGSRSLRIYGNSAINTVTLQYIPHTGTTRLLWYEAEVFYLLTADYDVIAMLSTNKLPCVCLDMV